MDDKFIYTPSKDSDYLQHWGKGGEAKQHLYTARKWVNGKWQYVYGKVNNALGADEREARDKAVKDYKDNKFEAHDYYKDMTNESVLKEHESKKNDPDYQRYMQDAKFNRNDPDAYVYREMVQRAQADKRRENRAKDAQAAYDKTVYGKIDKGKAKVKDIFGRLKNKAKTIGNVVKDNAKNAGTLLKDSISGAANYRKYAKEMTKKYGKDWKNRGTYMEYKDGRWVEKKRR